MKNSEKNSSKVNTNNNEVLNVETIKAQLKAACINMTAKETKEYIKGLAGYELRLTGQKPTQHYTVFYGEVRVCNVEQVQGIKADGTSRGCSSTAKVNFCERIAALYNRYDKIKTTQEENKILLSYLEDLQAAAAKIEEVLNAANERAANEAKKAMQAERFNKQVEKKAEDMTAEDIEKQLQILQAALAKKRA